MSEFKPVSFIKGPDVARRRWQNAYVYQKGPSWLARWREDVRCPDGSVKRAQFAQVIAPVRDPVSGQSITKRQAQRIAQTEIMSKLDVATTRPGSLLTVEEFIGQRFEPDWVAKLKAAGKKHYGSAGLNGGNANGQLKHVVEAIGGVPLRSVRPEMVQQACDARLQSGKSIQTVTHLRNAISAVFSHAKAIGYHGGDNPSQAVRLPEMRRKEAHALTAAQAVQVLRALPRGIVDPAKPLYEIVALSCATSLNIAEALGLRWKWVNLTAEARTVEAETVQPFSLRVMANNYRGAIGSPKARSRRRCVPLAAPIIDMVRQLQAATEFNAPNDLVFSGRRGRGLSETNLRRRYLAPIGQDQGLPFNLSWHVFRHTHATLTEQLGMALSDRQANMGHSAAAMTMHYTHSDLERRREGLEQLAAMLGLAPGPYTYA